MIGKCPKADEIIRPVLLGRSIKKYKIIDENLWIIFVPWHFPLHNDPTIKGASMIAEKEFEQNFPEVYLHLIKFKEQLSMRNPTETGIRYEWYAMQRFGSSYWEDFDKPKITWGNLSLEPQFAFTSKKYVINAPSPFIATDNLYLLAILNSRISKFYISRTGVARSGGYIEFKPMFVEKLPIPKTEIPLQREISNILMEIIQKIEVGAGTNDLEQILNGIISDLYGLNDQEKEYLSLI